MKSPQQSESSCETILLPDHPVFEKQPLPLTHLFELARLFQACDQVQQIKVKLETWVDVAAKTDNPADLRDLLLTDDGRVDRVPSIGLGVKEMFKQTEKERLPLLQKLVGCSIHLDVPKDKVFIPKLNPLDLAKPNQLNRTYGADRFISLRITDQLSSRLRPRGKKNYIQKGFEDFIHTPMRIGNRQFFVFLRKENFVWLVSVPKPGWESTKCFINEIFDLELNKEMTVAKWAARTSLLVSSTQSSIDLDPQDIRRIPDIYSDSLVISRALLCSVADTLGLSYLPSCIEGHIRNNPFVWRLGVPAEDDKYLIQLWEDQIGKASKHIFIKFRVRRYDHFQKTFVLTEESVVVLLEKCLSMGARPTGKPEIMTDGAGIISRTAANRVCESLGRKYDTLPSAYQARIGFAKGLWILPPELNTSDAHPWIEIRDSQWKADTVKGHHFHFNVNRISRSVASGTLGKQLLPILAARGVRAETVCTALKDYINATISDLNSNDPLKLTECLTRSGALRQARCGILNRTAGIQHDPTAYRSFNDNTSDPYFNSEYSASWQMTRDNLSYMSLTPNQCEEQIVSMLAAGFEPRNRFIVQKLRKIKEDRITTAIKFKVPIAQSTYVYVIPDPTGILKEDEAFLQFSNFRDDSVGVKISNLLCPALVSRSPCVTSTDVRKINLVDNESLRETYFDVMVCSIRGKTSLLSLLSGGDYDGDQVTVVWDPVLVQQFHNVNLDNYQRANVDKLFEPVQLGTVKDCLLEAYESDAEKFVKLAQSIQIAGFFTPNDTGSFSIKHTMAEYVFGLDDPLTQKLGEVYVKCLDAPKAGLKLKDVNVKRLKNEFDSALGKIIKHSHGNYLIPNYLAKDPKFNFVGKTKPTLFKFRGKQHILDMLLETGRDLLKKYRGELDGKDIATHIARFRNRDEDLPRYFLGYKKMYEFNKTDQGGRDLWIGVLRPLQRGIDDIVKDWPKEIFEGANSSARDRIWESEHGPGTGSSGKSSKYTFSAQQKYEQLSYEKAFEYEPEPEDIKLYEIDLEEFKNNIRLFLEGLGPLGYGLLKASCLSMCANPESFCPYDLAFREICYLKAMASQTKKTNNSILNHFPSKAEMDLMSSRPPRGITTTAYLTSVIKTGMILGRSSNEAQNLEPV